jgi:hypothetical protein
MKHRCYLAGPMTGRYEWNFPAFDAVAARLRAGGWEVISPAELDRQAGFNEKGMTGTESLSDEMKREFARRDLEALLSVDAVVVLPEWETSTGARHEVQIANWLGLEIREYVGGGLVDISKLDTWSGAQKPAFANRRAETLLTAESLVNGDRNVQYGDPNQDFARTADLWNAYLDRRIITATDVAVMQSLLKISRISWNPKKLDSWVDLAGYAACGADCAGAE